MFHLPCKTSNLKSKLDRKKALKTATKESILRFRKAVYFSLNHIVRKNALKLGKM